MLALFLGALDALVVAAAMPSIVADLGGIHLYSWVFSSYMLTRATALPIFGKLCDLYGSRNLFLAAVALFMASSVLAGAADSMPYLIFFRALQGIGAGGNFALAYVIAADLAPPHKRGKAMGSMAFVWGVASILGPSLGGFMVNYFSWRWIFYINLPLGAFAFLSIALFLKEVRQKKPNASVDYPGALVLTLSVLALLTAFLLGEHWDQWLSPTIPALLVASAAGVFLFARIEKRAPEPILAMEFFRIPAFRTANGAAFCSSFAIFSLSAFTPLYIQGVLGKSPATLGLAMIPLSLGWSLGALVCGQVIRPHRERRFSIWGALVLAGSTAVILSFTPGTPLWLCSAVLAAAGLGMGFVSISTLLVVQNSLSASDLGIATSSHQFARTLGGTIGIGASGSFFSGALTRWTDHPANARWARDFPQFFGQDLPGNLRHLFQSDLSGMLPQSLQNVLREAVLRGIDIVVGLALAASVLNVLCCFLLPKEGPRSPDAAPPPVNFPVRGGMK